jgi:hypothetical protein
MSGPALPRASLLSAIECLKDAIAALPKSTPEGSADGVVWCNFNMNPYDVKGPIFERIDYAFTQCFSQNPTSGLDLAQNVLRGTFGMDIVIKFLEQLAHFPKMSSSDLHLTELKVGQLTDLVYTR